MIVDISPTAYADLEALNAYIEGEAGRDVADAYDARVRAKIATLVNFPNRGTDRSVLGEGYRSITFERRLIIVYRVESEVAAVIRVLSAEHDLHGLTL